MRSIKPYIYTPRVQRLFMTMSIWNMLVLGLSILFGLFSTIFMVVAVASDYWEHTDWDEDKLLLVENLNRNASVFSKENAFYKIVMTDTKSKNKSSHEYYLRSLYGGIWRICDYVTGKFTLIGPYI